MSKPWYDRSWSRLEYALAGIALVGWIAAAFFWSQMTETRWLLDLERAVEVGMVADDICDRLGPPDGVYGQDSPSNAWQGGFTRPDSPIEHELWTWTFTSPTHCWYQLYVYVDEEGRVTSKFLGVT